MLFATWHAIDLSASYPATSGGADRNLQSNGGITRNRRRDIASWSTRQPRPPTSLQSLIYQQPAAAASIARNNNIRIYTELLRAALWIQCCDCPATAAACGMYAARRWKRYCADDCDEAVCTNICAGVCAICFSYYLLICRLRGAAKHYQNTAFYAVWIPS